MGTYGIGAEGCTVVIQGGTVTATSDGGGAGIGGIGASIEITGGTVTATGGERCPGIGHKYGSLYGEQSVTSQIEIFGGTVNAFGGLSAAGIGGGDLSAGGTITIYGGTVTATGGEHGAGIGGGLLGSGGLITINGGAVKATGGKWAAGIGGGYEGDEGGLAIDGMKVFASETATASVAPAQRERVCRSGWALLVTCTHDYNPRGVCPICGSDDGPVPYLDPTDVVSPGKVCAKYSKLSDQTSLTGGWYVARADAEIAGRIEVTGDVNLILCDGAELTAALGFHVTGANSLTVWAQSGNNATAGKLIVATPDACVAGIGGQYGAGIGGGRYAGWVAVEIRGGTVTAVAGDGAQAIGNGSGWNGDVGSLTIGGMSVFASAAATTPVATEQREGVCRSDWAKVELCPHDFSPQGVCQHCGADGGPVEYLDPTDADSPGKVCEAYASFAGQTSLTEGWYVARVAVQAQERIEIAGEVNLILCDGATLTAVQGFHVAEGNRLVIWGQSVGGSAGRLTVSGPDEFLAGIGGNANESGGAVAVYGGALSVDGGNLAAGIGGGYKGAGGMVEIAGGQVVATAGGDGVQAIGRGWGGDGAGSLGIGGMRVFASVAATEPVESAQRETVCRSAWAKIEPCPHEYENGFCCWCGGEIYGYAAWAVENGIVGAWDAKDVGGVANVFRYAFDKPAGLFILLGITIENGQVVILTPPLVNTEGYAFSILATDTVDGGGAAATPYPLDPSGRTVIDEPGKTCRFFRLRAVEK